MHTNSVSFRRGSEGPKHDPYSYTEITVNKSRNGFVKFHFGLDTWCEGNKIKVHGEPTAFDFFEQLVGVHPIVLETSVQRRKRKQIERHLKNHNAEGQTVSGYPGESFLICEKCGEFLSSHFNESAVL